MAIRFTASAARHGISQRRATYVVEHCCRIIYEVGDSQGRALFLGPDGQGVSLEVFGVELDSGSLLVFHVMKMQRKYLEDYRREMGCRER
jgi:hypothetical protein